MPVIDNDRSLDALETVTTNQTTAVEYRPPAGELVVITEIYGSAPGTGTSWVQVTWDGAPLFVTYGSFRLARQHRLQGDGAKVLRIELNNKQSGPRLMWCGYVAHRGT
jgi:hypothetical protein